MLHITEDVFLLDSEVELTAIRAQGACGQHINKVSTAIVKSNEKILPQTSVNSGAILS